MNKLLKVLGKLGAAQEMHVVYEAGPTGYGLQRALQARGYRQPMGVGAGGLAILSFLGDQERARLLPLQDKRLAEHSDGNLTGDRLQTLITETRGRGWATVTGFAEPGVTGVGIPLFNARKQPFAAITVGGFSLRMTEARIAQSVSILRAQTAQLW